MCVVLPSWKKQVFYDKKTQNINKELFMPSCFLRCPTLKKKKVILAKGCIIVL